MSLQIEQTMIFDPAYINKVFFPLAKAVEDADEMLGLYIEADPEYQDFHNAAREARIAMRREVMKMVAELLRVPETAGANPELWLVRLPLSHWILNQALLQHDTPHGKRGLEYMDDIIEQVEAALRKGESTVTVAFPPRQRINDGKECFLILTRKAFLGLFKDHWLANMRFSGPELPAFQQFPVLQRMDSGTYYVFWPMTLKTEQKEGVKDAAWAFDRGTIVANRKEATEHAIHLIRKVRSRLRRGEKISLRSEGRQRVHPELPLRKLFEVVRV